MITIENLAFSYGTLSVLENISMRIEPGSIYGLLGENGVGKTTLLTLLCGLKKPLNGKIDIDGYDPFDRKPGLLEQLYYLPDEVAPVNASAYDFAKETGVFWKGFSLEKFVQVLKEFEVDENQKMNAMSAGQLKKTYISFALACNARYYFMDEPTNGLDIPSKTQFRKAITKYTSEESAIVISTHQVRDLENIIDPVIILDKQDVLLNASMEEISEKLFFDYGTTLMDGALFREQLPGGFLQVYPNYDGQESKVNVEALFNAVHSHKDLIKGLFTKKEA